MESSKMHIAFCLDNNYLMLCGVAITSILENNKDVEITFHIIGVGLTDKSKKDLNFAIKKYTNASLIHYELDEKVLQSYDFNICNSELFTIATYARFFIADFLPKNIDKLLYLDCDIIVAKSLNSLWNIDITEYAIASAPDLSCMYDMYNHNLYEIFDFKDSFVYINAGVLLVNLKYWREHNLRDKMLDFSIKNKEKLVFADQDVINSVLSESRLILPVKYNVQEFYYMNEYLILKSYRDEVECAINQPVIIHYTGNRKPWLATCQHPLKNEFLKYKQKSIWRKAPLKWENETLKRKIRFHKRQILTSLGLRKVKPIHISPEKSLGTRKKRFKLVGINDNKDK